MQDISNMSREGLPSSKSLFKATGVAAVIGGVVLVTTILPAEYGIDPTGLGKMMGLTVLSQANAAESAQPEASPASSGNLLALPAGPVWKTSEGLSSDSTTVTLGPNEGLEVKATMAEGDRMVFNWTTEGGPVNFDMHGERFNDGDNFTSYWQGRDQPSASGAFEAPFDGTHGWYWENRGEGAVTVVLNTSGFYNDIVKK
ncbi:hypothetical protein SAMN04487869_12839 [Marinobacter sp. DSM 26671]|jgi:hypothetical protein|uniref:hypothetical protein n=1 Tax=unclassified Marinobacter TaxID=83889 RepID=UPI00069ED8DF|nr:MULTISPECIES: hypothetical protein [unclassified Marinobacter]AKV98059.1 hypothetical protein ACP86_18995 [Marinobacter sp. CP1]SFE95746.1 hypothetical protein SAMN04487869_12839 [Marinobacter sp. DSM 26671]